MKNCLTILGVFATSLMQLSAGSPQDHLIFEGEAGPGKGKHIVFLAGDEEYRSEEAMPLMAQLLAKQGFKCSVLFSLDDNGVVAPGNQTSLSNPAALNSADAIVMSLRFRKWPDATMEIFDNAFRRGIPIVALRTSTHAFNIGGTWAKYSFNAKAATGWDRGFGRAVLGETWVNHHGHHKKEGTRTVVEAAHKDHEILKGVGEIFGTTDVYGANPPEDCTILLRGQVTQTLEPDSPALEGKKNNPMQPVVWTRIFKNDDGKQNRIVTTTMGAATDLLDEDLRRLVANAVFWGLEMPVPEKIDVTVGDDYQPAMYSFGGFKKNKKPSDFIIKSIQAK